MMKLSLMKKILETVNAEDESALVNELLKEWNQDKNSLKMGRASANFTCFFKSNNQYYVLRFNEDSERDIHDINEEVKFLNYLHSVNINIAKPILSKNNKYIEKTKTEYGTFYSVVFNCLPGKHFEIEELDLDGFYQWGKCLGNLHKKTKDKPASIQIKRKTQIELFDELIGSHPSNNEIESLEIDKIKSWIKSLSIDKEVYGLIHYDFELDNLIWNDNKFSIIDFDDSVYSWFIADVAYALRDIFDEGGNIDLLDERFIKFINGYREITNLSDNQIDQIPYFYKFHNFILYKKLKRSVDLEIDNSHPEWVNGLITKLHKYINRLYQNFQDRDIW